MLKVFPAYENVGDFILFCHKSAATVLKSVKSADICNNNMGTFLAEQHGSLFCRDCVIAGINANAFAA